MRHRAEAGNDQYSRRIIGFAVQAGSVDGPAVCRLFNQVLSGTKTFPRHLSSDHDPLFEFQRWKANLRILDVTEVKTVPYMPLSHPFVERLIGTIRREFLDLVPFRTANDLERKLSAFQEYYNRDRVHRALDGVTPDSGHETRTQTIARLQDHRWRSHCHGLYQLPVAA